MTYEAVVGLEVHVQLKTKTKIFCACPTDFGAEPNTQICPVCAGHPGVLPVLNKAVVEGLVLTALALGCQISRRSVFARKQYFYPDLPKNYQISQYEAPLAEGGHLDLSGEGSPRSIRLNRIHLEEDAGKLLHAVGSRVLDYSLVDLNRAGVPLMEIVSEPDLKSPEEAAEYLNRLRAVLRGIGVSDCDMEKGSLRCDANVSVRPTGSATLGAKAEVKNMNSIRSVRDAIAYEIVRQTQLVESGQRVVQETRQWDQAQGITQSMRSKEEAHDYRYFPDPDLVPMTLSDEEIERWRRSLPELPEARQRRFETALQLSPYDAGVLVAEKEIADYFESALSLWPEAERALTAKPLVNWLTTELLGRLNAVKKSIGESPVSARHLALLVRLVLSGELPGSAGKKLFDRLFQEGGDPEEIVRREGLGTVKDDQQIRAWVGEVVSANAKIVADIQGGKAAALGALVGQVMKKSAGRAPAALVQQLLKEKLGI